MRHEGSRKATRFAQAFGTLIDRLSREKRGKYTAHDIVQESRPDTAPTHDMFEWDDRRAGEMFREEQARDYVRAIVVIEGNGKPRAMPMAISFGSGEAYTDTRMVLNNADLRERWIAMALRELESFKAKYERISELAGVMRAIDRTSARLQKPTQGGAGKGASGRGAAG